VSRSSLQQSANTSPTSVFFLFLSLATLSLATLFLAAPLPAQEPFDRNADRSADATSAPSDGVDREGQGSRAGSSAPDGFAVVAAMESVLIDAIDRAGRSVVAISRTRKDAVARDQFGRMDFFRPRGGRFRRFGAMIAGVGDQQPIPTDFASGVIISEEGMILTTHHAIENPRENNYRVWYQGRGYDVKATQASAEVQASDPWTDLAVLKIDAAELPAIKLGDADTLRAGSMIMTLGNPYAIARDGRASASWGIVSNLQRVARGPNTDEPRQGMFNAPESLREFGTLIQVDTRLNLGTSGGALVNLKGELVGVTTSLAAVTGFEQPAGYAIPIDDAMKAVVATMQRGRSPTFGFLGVEPEDLPENLQRRGITGAMVQQVVREMPADRAGIETSDVITALNGRSIDGRLDLIGQISRLPAGSEVTLTVFKGGFQQGRQTSVELQATLGKKPMMMGEPPYSRFPEPSWRGLRVDYSTVLLAERFFQRGNQVAFADVVVTSVEPDSIAWDAGIRPGQYVMDAVGITPTTPEEFYEAVGQEDQPVTLSLQVNGQRRRVVVPAN
jgi:serine protease Do